MIDDDVVMEKVEPVYFFSTIQGDVKRVTLEVQTIKNMMYIYIYIS
jgi:hypothetical protein